MLWPRFQGTLPPKLPEKPKQPAGFYLQQTNRRTGKTELEFIYQKQIDFGVANQIRQSFTNTNR